MSTIAVNHAQTASNRLFPEEANALLQHLVQQRWRRLSSEYHDPLGMLFGNRARQWTAGWDGESPTLYVLFWETDSWQEKPVWSLYRDGVLIFQEEDGFSKTRSELFQQLLESTALPMLAQRHFLEPVTDFRYSEAHRNQASQALQAMLLSRMELFEHLKEVLFQVLEADLGSSEWPLLEIMKVHRVARKNAVVDMFRHCVQAGLIRSEADCTRLDAALSQLQQDFATQGATISPLFLSTFQQAYQTFRQLVTSGNWRIRLHGAMRTVATT